MGQRRWIFVSLVGLVFAGLAVVAETHSPQISPLAAQSPAGPFAFEDINLGMSIAELKSKHPNAWSGSPAPVRVEAPFNRGTKPCGGVGGVEICFFNEDYLYDDNKTKLTSVQVLFFFLDGKLAVIKVGFEEGLWACFDPTPKGGTSPAWCRPYIQLRQHITDRLGEHPIFVQPQQLVAAAVRWENETSVAEWQNHECGPWDGSNRGWSKAIADVLEGRYCAHGDTLGGRLSITLYLDKELSRKLAMRWGEASN